MRLNKNQKKKIQQNLLRVGLKIVAEAKKRCPVDSGRLRASINTKLTDDGFGIKVGTNVKYAPHIEFGTAPYTIKPKEKKALHWTENGQDRFAKKVEHPGIKPQPFLRPAIDKVLNSRGR